MLKIRTWWRRGARRTPARTLVYTAEGIERSPVSRHLQCFGSIRDLIIG
jgi:hypothetical protein